MTLDEFKAGYSEEFRTLAYFEDDEGRECSGLLLETCRVSTSGVAFVYLNNYAHRVHLSRITKLRVTYEAW